MKNSRKLMLLLAVVGISGLTVYFGCGDYTVPEGADEGTPKSGVIIFTEEQEMYTGDSSYDVCQDGSTVSGQAWDSSKEVWAEFKFHIICNPAFDGDDCPYYMVVDECELDIPALGIDQDLEACGPWMIDLEGGKEFELTVISWIYGYQVLRQYVTGVGSNCDTFSYTAYLRIVAKAIDGTEYEAENYAIFSAYPQTDSCVPGITPPGWAGTGCP